MHQSLMFLDMMNHIWISDLSPLNHRHVLYSWDALYSEESISADGAHFPCSWVQRRLQSWLVVCPLVVVVGTALD